MGCCASRGAGAPVLPQSRPQAPSPGVPEAIATGPAPRISFRGGRSHIGTRTPAIPEDGEGIVRSVRLKPFAVDAYPVTVARFAAFVGATGYRSLSERLGHGLVFRPLMDDPASVPPSETSTPWWVAVPGACWHAPEGPGSSITQRMDHPVTHMAWEDARAFAVWAGGRLPSEAEWEHAARGGREDPRFPWGDREPDDHRFMPANIWQGPFPHGNSCADGWAGTSPVGSFPANDAGLYDMAGNVWEWTVDPFRVRSAGRNAVLRNAHAQQTRQKVMKGGSFLCHIDHCYRYRIAARSATEPDSGAANCGFRLFYDA